MRKLLSIGCWISLLVIALHCKAQKPSPAAPHPGHNQIRMLTDSGRHYENQGDKKMALHYHKRALSKAQQVQAPEHEARALANIAHVLQTENTDESLRYLNNALEIARSIRHHALQADIYSSIAAVYKQQENYKEALSALEQHHRFADTLLEINRRKEMAQVQATSDRKREQAIAITIILAVILIAIILAISVSRTRRLNKQLQYAVEVRDKLFSILAHDLRGPAGNIVQVLTMMEEDPFSEAEKTEVLGMLKKQSQSLSDTLDSLLHWSKAQLSGVEAHPAAFDPYTLTHKNLVLLGGQARQKALIIHNRVPKGLTVQADPDHIDLVIRNLLSNAVKFSRTGGSIEINAITKGEELVVSIADQGIGITPENQAKFTSHNMETVYGTAGEKGTGLGLLLVKEMIQANKGRIWLTSEKDKGTTFFFTVPFVPSV